MPSLKHAFVLNIPDIDDPTIVKPSDWNNEHVLTQASGFMLGRVTAGDALPTEELSPAQVRALINVADGSTANSTDAFLLARANHTGTESADVLTDGVTNKAFLATERTKLAGIATGADVTATALNATAKAAPVDADRVYGGDSAASFGLVYATWTQTKSFLKTYFDTLYQPLVAALTSWGAVVRAAGFDAFVAAPSSANLLSLLTTKTGTGSAVFSISPTLTGTPISPTAAVDTNTTQIATTAMVIAQAAAAAPLGTLPTAAVGTATRFARADHVHPGREVLTAARTYYVRTDGSDANTGLVNSAGGGFLTVQKAIDTAAALDTSLYDVTIQIVAGTYDLGTTGLTAKSAAGAGSIIIVGDEVTPANIILRTTGALTSNAANVTVQNVSTVYKVRGARIESTGSGVNFGLRSVGASRLEFQNVDFGAGLQQQIRAEDGGVIVATGNYSISGSSLAGGYHMEAVGSGVVRVQSRTITFTNTLSFSTFADAQTAGVIFATTIAFAGTFASVTGQRYSSAGNSVVNTSGGGASYFPGNSAGITATGGQYL